MGYLERNEYFELEPEEIEEAREVLLEEVLHGKYLQKKGRKLKHFNISVKQEMDHGEITNDAFEQVWHECFDEVC